MAIVNNKTNKYDKFIDKISIDKDNKSYISNDGKEAILEYNLIEYRDNMSLVDINLLTGRHHQIRVQMSYHGYPIYGDQKYGIDKVGIQIHLWAYKLKFKHPVKDEVLEFIEYPDFK